MAGILALTGGAATLLWILAVVLVIMGIVSIVRGGLDLSLWEASPRMTDQALRRGSEPRA